MSGWLNANVTEIAVRAQERRAFKLLLQGNLDGAIAAYREILSLDPDHANAHYQLGLCYRQRHRWNDAAQALTRAHELGEPRAKPLLEAMQVALAPQPRPAEHSKMPVGAEPAVVVGGRVLTKSAPNARQAGPESPDYVKEPAAVYAAKERRSPNGDAKDDTTMRPIVCPPLEGVFAPGGPLAALLGDRYRARAGQTQMAHLVRDALQGRSHAVIEAGTGIGKSFAYLIPVLWSGAQAVVSTSNKGLMNQLWEKDIPRLQQLAPHPMKAALLKGRSNYICALRLERLHQQVGNPNQPAMLSLVRKGLEAVPSGDVEMMRLPPELAARITVGGHDCQGHRCARFDGCFHEAAKREALGADLVVTNHALLCYNALLAENHILPVRPMLIVDEAHQLPRYAVEALTMALSHDLFWSLMNNPTVRGGVSDADLLVEARTGYDEFFSAVEQQRPGRARTNGRPPRWALEGQVQAGLALWDILNHVQRALINAPQLDDGDRDAAVMQVEELATTVRALALPEPETHIRLCEVAEETMPGAEETYQALYRPLEVADPLRRMLFEVWPRVVCTSATLSVNNDLGWFKRQIGLPSADGEGAAHVISQAIRGPFDYQRQMVLYTPRALTPVYDEQSQSFSDGYVQQLTEEVRRLLEMSRGRALVLCTSRQRMLQLYDALAPILRTRYPCYLQGDYAQPELVARFQADGNAILFATRGFWEGLDIPGDALALVILDKIPFVPYDDPVIQRQEAQIRARGGNPFYELQLGSAILNLRQGAGRLIRSETDRGVIALLDGRVLHKRYGQQIIRSLPESCHTTDFADVAAFLQQRPA
ncbi:MAG: tetratricopeptide repeat protein [Anaerolineae bacterium]|jgi:ATP-dependent DNA helicase DinG|nr:tetratricopeptide repeat protein [Anaerolineae bacterium]